MSERTCPHCGGETLPGRDGYWRHVRACDKNPDPACPKCGLHFVSYKIAGHIERCGSAKARKVEADSSPQPDAPTASAEPQKGRFLNDVPEDRLTATDKLMLPLLAQPSEKPAAPPPASVEKPKRRGRPPKNATAQVPQSPTNAPEKSAVATREEKGMPAAFEQQRPAPHLGAFASLGESVKRNWVLLAVILVVVVALIVWRLASRDDELKAPVETSATPPPVPSFKPPYNPEVHGSLEQYRAAFGHLPSLNGGA